MIVTHRFPGCSLGNGGCLWLVDHGWITLVNIQLYLGAMQLGCGTDHAFNTMMNVVPDFRTECTYGPLELRFLCNHVRSRTSIDLANSNDGRMKRVDFA